MKSDKETSIFRPRVHLDGVDVPPNFQLPPLEKVRADVSRIPQLKRDGPGVGAYGIFKTDTGPSKPTLLNEPLAYNMQLPDLFRWSYFVRVNDVSDDLYEPCIFALGMYIRVLQECDEEALRSAGHILPGQDPVTAKYFLVMNAGFKLVEYLLTPEIDRPADALPYLKQLAEEDIRKNTPGGTLPWIHNPLLYAKYADALVLSGSTDNKTKLMLERALEGLMKSSVKSTADIVRAKLNLAHVLHSQGIKNKEAKENEDYVIKFLRKTPHLYPNTRRSVVVLKSQEHLQVRGATGEEVPQLWRSRATEGPLSMRWLPAYLVLLQGVPSEELEGPQSWMPRMPTLHNEMAAGLKKLEALKLSHSTNTDVQRTTDWLKRRLGSLGADPMAPMHALGLHRDPSRGRTHIMFCQAEYTPDASRDMTHKFQISSAGVYCMEDVMPEIDGALGTWNTSFESRHIFPPLRVLDIRCIITTLRSYYSFTASILITKELPGAPSSYCQTPQGSYSAQGMTSVPLINIRSHHVQYANCKAGPAGDLDPPHL
ncbi:hypothetical protein BV22DRAFT_1127094 [Leucogyrophana mollusca]|uniref:Uncharacterized protein n=1 Tax=Leucogyrophana mollusca TaxID=85980 RepID=A0ACB8BQA9_9AGAM|nr:hypothetical protein BV22DRAFT_1127094 [Leucogyrophana mollusca]